MGRVFTTEQVTQGFVPEEGAQQEAAHFILRTLFEETDDGYAGREGIVAGLVHGGVAAGATDIRSDVDVVTVYGTEASRTALPLIGQTIGIAEHTYRVPVEATTLYQDAASSPLESGMDPLFVTYLRAVQQIMPQWSRNDPLPDGELVLDADTLYRTTIAYCSAKVRLFAGHLARPFSEGPNVHVMQRALELPSALGRKVLPLMLDNGLASVRKVGRESVSDKGWAYTKLMGLSWETTPDEHPLVGWMEDLASMDREYTALVHDVVDRSSSTGAREYGSWLHAYYRPAYIRAHDIALHWTGWLRNLYGEDYDNSFDAAVMADSNPESSS